MQTVFLSYSHVDKEVANAISKSLDGLGIGYFRDIKDIAWGQKIDAEVQRALEDAQAILVIVSPASLKSVWVPFEIGYFAALKRRILPYLVHPSLDLPSYLSAIKHVGSIEELTSYFEQAKVEWNAPQSEKSDLLPDIRVRYSPAIARHHRGGVFSLVTFFVENHDALPVFMNNVSLLLDDGRRMQIVRDSITSTPIRRQTLQPGQRLDVNITRDVLDGESVRPENVVGLVATDDIGRQFRGDPNHLQSCLAELFSPTDAR